MIDIPMNVKGAIDLNAIGSGNNSLNSTNNFNQGVNNRYTQEVNSNQTVNRGYTQQISSNQPINNGYTQQTNNNQQTNTVAAQKPVKRASLDDIFNGNI